MISHPEKVLFPEDGITKAELAAYYEMVAPVMVPHVRGRPVTMERFHRGIDEAGFFQKDVARGFPAWLERVEVPKKGGSLHHALLNDEQALLWMANQNCITPHVWASRVPDLFHPDVCVFDLDPAEDDPKVLTAAALGLRDLLAELGLPSWLKTTGSKGYHIVVPLDGEADFEEAGHFAYGAGLVLAERDPEHLTLEFLKADRASRIFIDTGRNGYSATFAAPYAVRARPGAPISAPCTWEELEQGLASPRAFKLRDLQRRIEAVGDLWSGLLEQRFSLQEPTQRLRALLGRDEWASHFRRFA